MAAGECPIDYILVEVVVYMGTTTGCPNYCDYNLQKYFVMINALVMQVGTDRKKMCKRNYWLKISKVKMKVVP